MSDEALERAYEQASEGGRFFSVAFIKRNGEHRKMICRKGVSRHLRGGKLSYDPEDYRLMVVWDTVKRDYCMIPTDASRVIRVQGRGKVLYEDGEE